MLVYKGITHELDAYTFNTQTHILQYLFSIYIALTNLEIFKKPKSNRELRS